MKKIFFLIISILIFNSCSNENLVGINTISSSNGALTLKIQKTNIPVEVFQIIAELSRENHDTLRTDVYVSSDSLSELSFTKVLVGKWQLKVMAKNSDGNIIYSGETDVNIIEDETVDVYLTLTPVRSGKGNINIFINWDDLSWIDYKNNPVLLNSGSAYGSYGFGNPKVILENGIYKMWYKNLESNGISTVSYAESNDGINWEKIGDGPVLGLGKPGNWDAGAITTGPVIKENGIYKIYYSAAAEAHQPWQIGLATSTDGIHWDKYPDPVLYPGSSGWDYSIGGSSLVKIDSIYYLYYHGWEPTSNYREGLATSTDGIHWTKFNGNPILTATENWEGTGAYYSSIIYENGLFKMVYMNYLDNNMGFGKATSIDGIHWTKDSDNPYFTGSNTSNNWTSRPIYPCLINTGNNYRLYYNSSYITGSTAIGFLTINKF